MKQLFFFALLAFFLCSLYAQKDGLTTKQYKEIEAIMAPLRLKVENNLKEKDAQMYKSYQQDMLNVLKMTDETKRKLAMSELKSKYYAFVQSGFAAANINESDIKTQLSLILKGFNFKFTEFLGITVVTQTPTTPSNPTTCKEYECPFAQRSNTSEGSFLAGGAGTSQNNCGMSVNSCTIFVGSKIDEVAAGENITANANINTFDITAKANYHSRLFAMACVGGSYAKAQYGFKVSQGSNVKFMILRNTEVFAPVVWCTERPETIENDEIRAAVSVVPNTTYKVQICTKSEAFTANLMGGADVDVVISNIDYLKVCQINK